MKGIIILVSLILVMAACQQKEEPKSQISALPLQTQDALKRAQEAVKNDPANVNAWIQLGNISMDTSRFNEAIDAYQKALSIDPRNVDVRVDMGTCYRNSGKPDVAVKEYKKALEIDPNHPNGHRNLAVVLAYDLKDNLQAVREFERYVQLVPNARDAENVRQEIQRLKASK